VPADSGFYVETTDSANAGTYTLDITLTNAGVSLTQSITLTVTLDCLSAFSLDSS